MLILFSNLYNYLNSLFSLLSITNQACRYLRQPRWTMIILDYVSDFVWQTDDFGVSELICVDCRDT